MSKPILLVVFQSRFTNFHYKLLELEHYKPEFEVVVLDLSELFLSKSQQLSNMKTSDITKVITPQKWSDLLLLLFKFRTKLIDQSASSSFSIYGATIYSLNSFVFHCFFLLILKRYFYAVIRLWNGGILIPNSKNLKKQNGFLSLFFGRIKNASSILELKRYCKAKFFEFFSRVLPLAHSHVLVAGSDWLGSLKTSGLMRRGVRVILGHSFDYSAFLASRSLKRPLRSANKKLIAYLDTGSPKFLGDSSFTGRRVFYTVDKWYPSLCHFFSFIEKSRGCSVKVAAHYKATHDKLPDYFGFREVVLESQDLVTKSQEVLSAGSTATSMAVFLNKPIVFLTSNQQNQDNTFVEHIEEMSTTLCMPLVNIDDSKSKWPLFPYPVNTYKYNQYVLRCLSSSTLKEPNFVLIKKEIIKNLR